jgi:hypothetical protein
MAHKLARLVYRMLKFGQQYVDGVVGFALCDIRGACMGIGARLRSMLPCLPPLRKGGWGDFSSRLADALPPLDTRRPLLSFKPLSGHRSGPPSVRVAA